MAKAKKKAAPKKDGPLKIHGSFADVIAVSVGKTFKKNETPKKK